MGISNKLETKHTSRKIKNYNKETNVAADGMNKFAETSKVSNGKGFDISHSLTQFNVADLDYKADQNSTNHSLTSSSSSESSISETDMGALGVGQKMSIKNRQKNHGAHETSNFDKRYQMTKSNNFLNRRIDFDDNYNKYDNVEINKELDDCSTYLSNIQESNSNFDIIRKSRPVLPSVYRQNISIRFLQPPQIIPGPLIIREIRPDPIASPPPLIIKQRAYQPSPPPPLILREKPPSMPIYARQQIIIKHLPSLPPPPRQVIIERYPPLPPKPRDIIIERWLPYKPVHRRIIYVKDKSIQQRTPNNKIVIYEAKNPRYEQNIHMDGIQFKNPQDYIELYGNTLLDSYSLLSIAKNYGIVENINGDGLQNGYRNKSQYQKYDSGYGEINGTYHDQFNKNATIYGG